MEQVRHTQRDLKYLEFFTKLLEKSKFNIKKESSKAGLDNNIKTYLFREKLVQIIDNAGTCSWTKKLSPEQLLLLVRKHRRLDNQKYRRFTHVIKYDAPDEKANTEFYDAIKSNDMGIVEMSIQVLKGLGYKIMKPTTGWEEI